MKKTFLLIFAVVFVSKMTVYAQDIPKKEFAIAVAEKNLTIQPGETKKYDITILRSKSYKKTSIDLLVDSSLPEGITVSFENGTDPATDRVMVVTADQKAKKIKKGMILKGKSSRASKGILLNLQVE